jgi:DNA-binding NtrC family response regulator
VILSENDRPISGAALGIELPAGAVEDVVESDWQPPASPVTGPDAQPLTPRVAPASPPPPAAAPVSAPPLQSLAEMEKQAILAAMKAKEGNRAQVVELLGISIRTLRNKLQEYRESGDFSDE